MNNRLLICEQKIDKITGVQKGCIYLKTQKTRGDPIIGRRVFCLKKLKNLSAAENTAGCIVKHRRLSGRGRAYLAVKGYSDGIHTCSCDRAIAAAVVIADFYICPNGISYRKIGDTQKIQLSAKDFVLEQTFRFSQHHFIGIRPDFADIDRFTQCDSQTLPLTDCVMDYALVSAEELSLFVHKISFIGLVMLRLCRDKVRVAAVRHKADFLRIRLIRDRKTRLFRDASDLLLRQPAERHEGTRKLLLRQPPQHIGLILFAAYIVRCPA